MQLSLQSRLRHPQRTSWGQFGHAGRLNPPSGPRRPSLCRGVSRHLDEELQHMLWQLDVRHQQSDASIASSEAPHRQQRVFRGGRRQPQQQQQQHQQQQLPLSTSSMSIDLAAAEELAQLISDHSQHMQQAHAQQQQQQQYHHVRLQPQHNGSRQLRLLADKLARHMADGGCLLSAAADVQSCQAMTELLVLLAHKQAATPDELLLLQSVQCGADHGSGSDKCMAAAQPASAAAAPGSSSSSCIGEAEDLCLWLTSMPLHTLLRLLAEQQAAPPAQKLPAAGAAASVSSIELDASMMSLQSLSDDGSVGRSSSGSSSSSSSSRSRGRTAELLRAAQRSGSAAAAALAHAAAAPAGVVMLSAGGHSDPDVLSHQVARATAAGALVALRVKAHAPGAAAVAHAALHAAASRLAGSDVQLGLLLVPGAANEHVHSVAQHASNGGGGGGSSSSSSRMARDDASMDVAAFGALAVDAAGHGSSSGGSSGGQLRHRHEQEVWLCALPLCASV